MGSVRRGREINARDAQYFGLLDDVAIFTRALSTPEVQDLSENIPNLTSSLPDLLAGYPFATGRLPSKLARPVILKGAAQRVTTSADRNSASDAALLPLPTMHEPMDLPFPPGEAWDVIKGVDTDGEHHDGYASFCWDFNPHGKPVASEYPGWMRRCTAVRSRAGLGRLRTRETSQRAPPSRISSRLSRPPRNLWLHARAPRQPSGRRQ